MKILIIEDEPQAAARLESLIRQIKPKAQIVDTLDSVKGSVIFFKSPVQVDLVFMDIQLSDGLSFEIFDQAEVNTPIIFTTAYNEYALNAFKVNSIDYILKPVDKEELEAAFRKYELLTSGPASRDRMMESIHEAVRMIARKYKERFVIRVGEHLKYVEVRDILFFLSQDKATFAQTSDKRKHILDFTLDQTEEMLDPERFFRINRKYIISMNSIQDMISYTNSRLKLVLRDCDDQDVIVARERVQEFRDWLDK